jgi:anti-anti-sigma regulatory factor
MSVISPLSDERTAGWLEVSTARAGRDAVALVAGEADWDTAAQLRQALVGALADGPQSLIVDVTNLTFCNLRGLDSLHEAMQVARQAGVRVTLRGMSRQLAWLHHRFPGAYPEPDQTDDAWQTWVPAQRAFVENPDVTGRSWESAALA